MAIEKIVNISSLRKEIGEVFSDLRNKKIDVHDAATLAKLADTMISSSKVELDYSKFSNNPKRIDFLETDGNKNGGRTIDVPPRNRLSGK